MAPYRHLILFRAVNLNALVALLAILAGFHLYTSAFLLFTFGAVVCTVLLLFTSQFSLPDSGLLNHRGFARALSLSVVIWMSVYLVATIVAVLTVCGLGL